MTMLSTPDSTASSTPYWITGLSTRTSISFGWAFVAGRNRVPSPAAGRTALRTLLLMAPILSQVQFPRDRPRLSSRTRRFRPHQPGEPGGRSDLGARGAGAARGAPPPHPARDRADEARAERGQRRSRAG